MTALDWVSLRIDSFDVAISVGGETLWQGEVKVNRMTSATYETEARFAAGSTCLPLAPGRSGSWHLTLDAMKYGGNVTDPDTYRFRVALRRTDLAADCRDTIGSNASAERTLRIRRRERVEITGGGNIRMSIRRLS